MVFEVCRSCSPLLAPGASMCCALSQVAGHKSRGPLPCRVLLSEGKTCRGGNNVDPDRTEINSLAGVGVVHNWESLLVTSHIPYNKIARVKRKQSRACAPSKIAQKKEGGQGVI